MIDLLILIALLLLNGAFAMSEIALISARKTRLKQAVAKGESGAASALALAGEPSQYLSTVQIGITLIGILCGAFGERSIASKLAVSLNAWPVLAPWSNALSLLLVVLLITYLSLIIGELVPKRLAMINPEGIAKIVAAPMQFLSRLTSPLVFVLSGSTDFVLRVLRARSQVHSDVSEEDVRGMIAEGAKTGVFQPEEQELVERVFRVGDLRVASIMVPRSDIVWLNEGDTAQRVRITVGTSPYSHFPVCRGNMDQLLGVVHVKDLVKYGLIAGAEMNVSELAQEPLFVPETTPVLNLLDLFEQNRTHIAFIVDEYGATQGLVTLSDVTGAILGEIKRRGDEEPPDAVRRPDGSWLVDGSLPLYELAEIIGLADARDDEQPEVNTVAGIVLALLGHIPRAGETVDWRGWQFEVMDMDRQRVDKVLASRLPPSATGPEQANE